MGFEHFRVSLHGGRTSSTEADERIRQLPHIQLDHDALSTSGSTYYVMADGKHVVELELMESPVYLSCRFTLCHPPSIDSVFLDFVRELMIRLRMDAWVCDAVLPEEAHAFSLDEFANFSAIAFRCIAARRAEWIAGFGDQVLAATTNEVYREVILPQCQPGIHQPT